MPLFQNRTDFEYVERLRKFYGQRKKYGTVFLFLGTMNLFIAIIYGWFLRYRLKRILDSLSDTDGMSAGWYEIGLSNGFLLGLILPSVVFAFVVSFYLLSGSRKERILLESFDKSQRLEPTT